MDRLFDRADAESPNFCRKRFEIAPVVYGHGELPHLKEISVQADKCFLARRCVRDLWLAALGSLADLVECGTDLGIAHFNAIGLGRVYTSQNPAFNFKQDRREGRILHDVGGVHRLGSDCGLGQFKANCGPCPATTKTDAFNVFTDCQKLLP